MPQKPTDPKKPPAIKGFQRVGELLPQIHALTAKERQILDAATSMFDQDAIDANALGFSTRLLVQASLPHRDPGNDRKLWQRVNGNLTLKIQPDVELVDGEERSVGFPFGTIPRLVLLYFCTQAYQTGDPTIYLGSSLSHFMREIGLEVTGGKTGTIARFKNQLERLVRAHFTFSYSNESGRGFRNSSIADGMDLWWDLHRPDQGSIFQSRVILRDAFFREIMEHPVPVDKRAVAVLKQSPLALDLYTWLTHRVTWLKKPVRISWYALQSHVGSEYSDTKNFKRHAKESLASICAIWPELKLESVTGGFMLKPSRPHVPSKTLVQFPAPLLVTHDEI